MNSTTVRIFYRDKVRFIPRDHWSEGTLNENSTIDVEGAPTWGDKATDVLVYDKQLNFLGRLVAGRLERAM